MTPKQAAEILREYQRWRRETYEVGSKVRLKHDHELHTITRVEEYDYRQPYQIDGKFWINGSDIEQPDPSQVGMAIDCVCRFIEEQ